MELLIMDLKSAHISDTALQNWHIELNTNNRLQEDEAFLKTRQLCSYSRISQHFMKP
jgi:hypothetical protein